MTSVEKLTELPHADCRVLIVLGLDVLGHADTVGNPLEYDKVVSGVLAPPPAAGNVNYQNLTGTFALTSPALVTIGDTQITLSLFQKMIQRLVQSLHSVPKFN